MFMLGMTEGPEVGVIKKRANYNNKYPVITYLMTKVAGFIHIQCVKLPIQSQVSVTTRS